MTDDERISITMDRFAPLKQGRGPASISTLAKRFKRDPAMITRAIAGSFKSGIVELVPFTSRPQGNRIESMEMNLERKYPFLWRAIVVEANRPPDPSNDEQRRRFDDDIHRKLGYAMAHAIRDWRVTKGDNIGFGSGRGVFYTVNVAGKRLATILAEGLDLISLTGAVHARDHSRLTNVRMDGDFHVGLFGPAVQNTATLHLVSYPITANNERNKTCLGAQEWERLRPSLAVTGVGVLAPGHRFVELVTQDPSTLHPIYTQPLPAPAGQENKHRSEKAEQQPSLIDLLRNLVQVCREQSEKYQFYPVADICNHLIPIENSDVPDAERARIVSAVRSVNARLLNVDANQLAEIPALLVVAGGERKAAALRQILQPNPDMSSPRFNVRILCVDQHLASEILKEKPSPSDGWQGW